MRIKNTELAKLALSIGWTVDLGGGMIWEIKHRYDVSEKRAHAMYSALLDSGLIEMETRLSPKSENTYTYQGRFKLCEGVTEDML